ncbi:MAG TPA: hypothetical protein VL173_12515 [Vicinamibacterales bacterium]|jgi:hypothetical protein|nr:hypothetical protein [Vicinamibacterales bacterium]
MKISIGGAAIGGVVLLLGLMLRGDRIAASYLAMYTATVSTAIGVLLMIMIAHLSGAIWFVPFRPAAETITAALPWLAALAIPLVILSPAVSTYFTLRAVMYWAVWLGIGELLLRNSREVASQSTDQRSARMTVLGAAGIPAAALALTFAAFDWMMSLSPGWSSTVYGPYVCTGGVVAALAVLAVAGTAARDDAIAAGREHYQSLGQLLLACVLLWAYLWYSQFFVIWIASLPREVSWYVVRFASPWRGLTTTLVVTAFLLPFLVLLFRTARGSRALMIGLAAWLLIAHYADVYWLVVPSMRSRWVPSDLLWDLAAASFVIGSTAAVAIWRHRTSSLEFVDDAAFEAVLRYEAP